MYGEVVSERVFARELQRMEMVVAGSPGLAAQLAGASAALLGSFPWIITPGNCPFHAVATRFFTRHGIVPTAAALVDDESIIRSMVKNGVGLSFLLREDALGTSSEDRLAIWDQETLPLPLSIACLARRRQEPILQALVAGLCQLWLAQG
jgi:DNA-binding transcriptional LysR family regulator